MKERRRSVRQNCRLCGRVYFNVDRKSRSLPCTIRDISYEGARIELLGPVDIQIPSISTFRDNIGRCMPVCDGAMAIGSE